VKEKKIAHAFVVLYHKMLSLIPKTRRGDKAYSVITFIIYHKRLPIKKFLFNDVLHQLKISGELQLPLRVFTTDKEFVKQYIKSVVGEKYIIPTTAILRSAAEVNNYNFPADCCIKPTHASGEFIFRKSSELLETDKIKKWLSLNCYLAYREANYRVLTPTVIVEPILFNTSSIKDYRVFCFQGKPRFIMLDLARNVPRSRKLYDTHWNEFECDTKKLRSLEEIERPKNLDEMLRVAEKLSAKFSFVRVDLYTDGNVCQVGEITHCHSRALESFWPKSYESKISKCIFSDNHKNN